MPVLDGFELATHLRNYYQERGILQPKIIALTGHVDEAYRKKAWECLINEVVNKPLTVNGGATIIRELINQR